MDTTAVRGNLETTIDRTPRHRVATATRGSRPDHLSPRRARSHTSHRRRHADMFRRRYAAQPSSAAILREELKTYLAAYHIDDAATQAIVLCADEALINAVAHAAGSPVGVFADLRDGQLTLDVSDEGPGFDPSRICSSPAGPPSPPSRRSGRPPAGRWSAY
jgi:anti-sigma regulatory factor (Ser/Thr protein kinase)